MLYMTQYKKINYFDLGAHMGEEMDMFLHEVKDIPFNAYLFEAHPEYAKNLINKYSDYENIQVLNYAITDAIQSGQVIKLYLASFSEGNSIYAGKSSVMPGYSVNVTAMSIVNWIKENVNDYETCINILRCNIEGAELLLFNDLVNQNFVNKIHFYLGSYPGIDIKKCREISHLYDDHISLLQANNIQTHLYCKALGSKNVKIMELIKQYIN